MDQILRQRRERKRLKLQATFTSSFQQFFSHPQKGLASLEKSENLRQKRMEAKFWQSFAKTERITINGQTIQF
jgi:hypothetical protein